MRKTIIHGNILGDYTIKGPDINKLIFQRCKYLLEKPKKKKLKKDFGQVSSKETIKLGTYITFILSDISS